MRLRIAYALLIGFILLGCGQKPPDFADRVAQGQRSFEGIIETLPQIDIYQSGTHQLKIMDDNLMRIQSSKINLNRYLGKPVRIHGEMSEDSLGLQSVMSVTGIEALNGEENGSKNYENKREGFAFEYPSEWELAPDAGETALLLNGKKIISINVFSTTDDLQSFTLEREGQNGAPVTVAGQEFLRYISENFLRFYVPNASRQKIYMISFIKPNSVQKREETIKAFYVWLEKFTILISQKPTGKRCGGPAKLECPEGFRCELFNIGKEAAGVCVSLAEDSEQATCPFILPPEGCDDYEVADRGKNGCPTRYICPVRPDSQPANE